jgi:hypothetical protein
MAKLKANLLQYQSIDLQLYDLLELQWKYEQHKKNQQLQQQRPNEVSTYRMRPLSSLKTKRSSRNTEN